MVTDFTWCHQTPGKSDSFPLASLTQPLNSPFFLPFLANAPLAPSSLLVPSFLSHLNPDLHFPPPGSLL